MRSHAEVNSEGKNRAAKVGSNLPSKETVGITHTEVCAPSTSSKFGTEAVSSKKRVGAESGKTMLETSNLEQSLKHSEAEDSKAIATAAERGVWIRGTFDLDRPSKVPVAEATAPLPGSSSVEFTPIAKKTDTPEASCSPFKSSANKKRTEVKDSCKNECASSDISKKNSLRDASVNKDVFNEGTVLPSLKEPSGVSKQKASSFWASSSGKPHDSLIRPSLKSGILKFLSNDSKLKTNSTSASNKTLPSPCSTSGPTAADEIVDGAVAQNCHQDPACFNKPTTPSIKPIEKPLLLNESTAKSFTPHKNLSSNTNTSHHHKSSHVKLDHPRNALLPTPHRNDYFYNRSHSSSSRNSYRNKYQDSYAPRASRHSGDRTQPYVPSRIVNKETQFKRPNQEDYVPEAKDRSTVQPYIPSIINKSTNEDYEEYDPKKLLQYYQ